MKFTKIVDEYPEGFERIDTQEEAKENEDEIFAEFQNQVMRYYGVMISSLEEGGAQLKELYESVKFHFILCGLNNFAASIILIFVNVLLFFNIKCTYL